MYSPENEIYSSLDKKLNLKISFSFGVCVSFLFLVGGFGFVLGTGIRVWGLSFWILFFVLEKRIYFYSLY